MCSIVPPFGYMSPDPCALTPYASAMTGRSFRMPRRTPTAYSAPACLPNWHSVYRASE